MQKSTHDGKGGYFFSKIIQVQTAIVNQIIKVQNPISRIIKSSPIKGKSLSYHNIELM